MEQRPQAPAGWSIKVIANGPYEIKGDIPVQMQTIGANKDGESEEWVPGKHFKPEGTPFYLCRCGHSSNKPFCDSTHLKMHFDGAETAGHEPYVNQADLMEGPTALLTDAQQLCAFARFCDPNGQVWAMIDNTDDPAVRQQFIKQVGQCPSGRLVAWDRETQTPIEPALAPAIGVIEDPAQGVSGPLYIQGGIPIHDAHGKAYEVRNRVTLCRCGASRNKPYCDGSHAAIKFKDGL
ncbi:CDGSH iron-sulfur domain-containing protein [Chitinophaga vietnamensis]|uniref:CDGSH iron-sulfur domain-containing protein n=1 Tax=Chitinophaga vietnamensis TaxID=2593957 RepID=UPI001177CE39|nr:CDGSH iron-sulfur domain-containing protein [Chitinophaga vietnamensis]